jgi:hypothetical protein
MAQNVFNPETNYSIKLLGHRFDGYEGGPSDVHGYFAADTVEVSGELSGEREYAVFTVDEPVNGEYPHAFVGTYRLAMSALLQNYKQMLFPEPEPEE